jgi:hypothetical protein
MTTPPSYQGPADTATDPFSPAWIKFYNSAGGGKIACLGCAYEDIAYGSVSYNEFIAGAGTPKEKLPHPQFGQFQWGIACSRSTRTIGLDGDYPDRWAGTATGKLLGSWRDVANSIRDCGNGTFKFHVLIQVPTALLALWPKQLAGDFGHIKSNGLIYVEGMHASGTAYVDQGRPWVVATEELMRALLTDNGGVLHTDRGVAFSDDFDDMCSDWIDPDDNYSSNVAAEVLGDWSEGERNESLMRRCGIIKAAGGRGLRGMGRLFGDLCTEYDSDTGRGDADVYRAFSRCYPAGAKLSEIIGVLPAELIPPVSRWGAPAPVMTVPADEPDPDNQNASRPRKPGADSLVDVILKSHDFARDIGGELFALPGEMLRDQPYVPLSFLTKDVWNLAHDIWRQMSLHWNAWVHQQVQLIGEEEAKKRGLAFTALTPSSTLMYNAVNHLEALAARHGRKVTAQLRSVEVPGGLVIDLGDDTGQVVHVTAGGWAVTDPRQLLFAAPVFRRSLSYLPLAAPVRGGNLSELWTVLRIRDETIQDLSTGWLVAAFFAGVNRPGLWITGTPGSGKTTLGGGLARLTDGTEWLDGRLDKSDERNNIIRAAKHYVVSFDNMTMVTGDVSDWICTLVTGHQDTFRKMKTNFDDVSMAYKRTFIATGLSLPYGLGADALDRIIEVPCPAISEKERSSDEVIPAELDKARPRLLGALLDHISATLAMLPHIPAEGRGYARMNGYARMLAAHDIAYGGNCLEAYLESSQRVREEAADAEPVATAIRRLFDEWSWPCMCSSPHQQHAQGQPVHMVWQGTKDDLYRILPRLGNFWPEDSRALNDKITALDAVLRAGGFLISRHRTTTPAPERKTVRYLRITRSH